MGIEIQTERLRLMPMTVEAIDALIVGDRVALEAEVGATFPDPLAPPPETDDVLEFFRDIASRQTEWTPRFVVLRDPPTVVGSGGAMPPDPDGRCIVGYGIYPEHEANGYATEATLGLIAAYREHIDVKTIAAAIHPYNLASRRVAEKAGMRVVGEVIDPKDGRLEVWEVVVRPDR